MTQPSDPSRATTRRDSRHIVEITDVESVSDGQAEAAIQAMQVAIHYLYSGEGAPPPSKEADDAAYVQCQDAFELLLRYTRERHHASRHVAERFNTSRREINGRLVQLQAELDERNEQLARQTADLVRSEESLAQLQAWVDQHDPLLVELEASDAKLREEKSILEAKLEAARQEIVALTVDQGRLSTELAQARQKQAEQQLGRSAAETQARTENERLKADLAKAKQERERAQYAEQSALEARDEALKAKATALKDYNDLKRQVGSKVLQPILVIGTKDDIAKGDGKTEEQLIKLFPSPNLARFLIKVLEAVVHLAQKPANIDALIDEVKLARASELDPYFDPRQPFPEALANALNECRVWFGKIMLAFEDKGRQLFELSQERKDLYSWQSEVMKILRELRKEAHSRKES